MCHATESVEITYQDRHHYFGAMYLSVFDSMLISITSKDSVIKEPAQLDSHTTEMLLTHVCFLCFQITLRITTAMDTV